jgi:hypothetical protein
MNGLADKRGRGGKAEGRSSIGQGSYGFRVPLALLSGAGAAPKEFLAPGATKH